MKRKTKNKLKDDSLQINKEKNRNATFNFLILFAFVFQLILPVGLHINAMTEPDESEEPVTVQVQDVEENEKAEEPVEVPQQEEEVNKEEESDKSEDSSVPTPDEPVEEKEDNSDSEELEEEEKAEEEEEEAEEEKAENYPAIATPAIPIPMGKLPQLAGDLADTIKVKKTAKRTEGCRTFEVNLNITGEPQKAPVDVVLVIDRSGSMNDSAGQYTRLYYAKEAAINFAERVLGQNGIPGSRVSVVSFSGPDTTSGYGNQRQARTDLDLNANLMTVSNTINSLSAVNGTNTEAGFKQGQTVIQGATSNEKPNSNKVVIMLTDGLPTASNGNKYKDTTDINHIHLQRAIAAGKNIFQSELADVFTIGLTTGMSGAEKALADNFLTQAQNKGYYPAPSAQDLDRIFNEISQSLGYAATDAKVVDKLGDQFDLIESSLPSEASYNPTTREITWNPGTIGKEASLSYKVVAKSSFSGGEAETNKFARLTYTDIFGTAGQTKDFPKPKVDVPTLLQATLTDATINLGDSINLGSGTDPMGENYQHITGGDGNGSYSYEWRIAGETEVFSTAKNPKVTPSEDTKYELKITDSNGCIAVVFMHVRLNKNFGEISITKRIKDFDELENLKFFGGADFSMLEEQEFEIKVKGPNNYERIVTLKHGETEVLNHLVLGDYSIEEINVDDGFLLENIHPTAFKLTKRNKKVAVDVLNKINYANFEFIKVDEERNPLKGIEFEFKKGEVKETLTSDENGKVSINFLEPGEYQLKETKTLAGFKLPTTTWIIQVVKNEETGVLEIIIPDDSFLIADSEKGNVIVNEGQSVFPQTGGIGGVTYIATGLIILSTSLGIYLKKEAI